MRITYHLRFIALLAAVSSAQAQQGVTTMDPDFSRIVKPNEKIEKVAGDFKFTEGPVWLADKRALLFSDIPADRIVRWAPTKEGSAVGTFRSPCGQSNGLTLDKQGRLIACEGGNRRVTRTEADGAVTALADRFDGKPAEAGKRLNSPNDVVVKSDGAIYFTDPPYGVDSKSRELDFQAVWRISPDGKTLTPLDKTFNKPNGLAFSPDEKILYIADSEGGHIRAFDVAADGAIANGRVFAQMPIPDGMKVDVEGNVYCCAEDGVEVFSPGGKKLGVIAPAEQPANCAFGDADWKTLYMTCHTGLYRIRVNIAGVKVP